MAEASKKHFLAEIEEQLLVRWHDEQTFESSLEARQQGPVFSFYDGPPFANGMPHYGHLLQTTIKDTLTRYKTMCGFYVPRRIGWDTHGLPVEYAIEKQHDFKSKKDILNYGIGKFNAECRESVFMYRDVWEKMFQRVGRWADYSNTYATLDESYMESVWWVFKSLYDKGLVYKDFRSSPYCPRCATPLSNFELNQGYRDDVADPSLYVKFKLQDQAAYLLGWTTTPWSLPGNAAIAVKPDARYCYVELADDEGQIETLVLAESRLEVLNVDNYKVIKEVMGNQLVGLGYEPLFKLNDLEQYEGQNNLYKIWAADFVSIDEGSGVLHVAPAFGEDDLALGKQYNIPVLLTVDENGHIQTDKGLPDEFAGKFFKQADQPIIAELTKRSLVYAAETFHHTYPFCWRCDTPLLYYATDSWLVKVSQIKDQLVKSNQVVNWTPGHIKKGRFGNWLEAARDWSVSRNRFWGAPLPIWVTDDGEVVVIGSVEELRRRAVNKDEIADLHRPYIDDIEVMADSGKVAHRIPEVFDCWFESGSMPYAQDHYPFENAKQWEARYPADFIAEAIDQTRGWFYTLHVLGGALFDQPAFKNVICSGWIVAADGEKLSKRKKNYAPMDEIFDQYGVDSLRYFLAASPLVNGEDIRFSTDLLRDVQRRIFMTLNNIFSFYKLYADVDHWQPEQPLVEPSSAGILDKWILARLNQTISETTTALDQYRLDQAVRPIDELLDDISNWFVRRSRRRFWKSEDDNDKQQAYNTLHYVLLRLCQLMAPFAPFLPDHIWRQLVEGTELPTSVHLSDWPVAGHIDQVALDTMQRARNMINEGLSQRAAAGIKVRQPLAKVSISADIKGLEEYGTIFCEELNVKQLIVDKELPGPIMVDTNLSEELRREGLMREVVRNVQSARKQANLNVDDRIILGLESSDDELIAVLSDEQLIRVITQETLAVSLSQVLTADYEVAVKVEGHPLNIKISQAK